MVEVIRREAFEAVIPPSDRADMIKSYYKLLTDSDETVSLKAAQEWSRWETCVVKLFPDAELRAKSDVNLKWAR